MNKPEDYVAIRVWNASSGSFQYYWKNEQEKACEQDAPIDALYYRDEEKRWITLRDLKADHPFHQTLKEWTKK